MVLAARHSYHACSAWLAGWAWLAILVNADVYMHNPRGSNDRNCERDANRNNGARLFDSQNNAAGGYACPRAVGDETVQDEDDVASFGTFSQNKRMYYYEGSWLPIEWTNQHGCGQNSEVNCEIILQYQCEDIADPMVDNFWPYTEGKNNQKNKGQQHFRSEGNIGAPRDGIPRDSNDAATDTIPDNEASAIPNTKETRRFGMQESYDYYQLCQRTERNKGLYTADQRVRRKDQRGTRQNPNGNRQGFECPEEKDYYPWWHPSPWIDIAVLTNEAGPQACSSVGSCTTQRCRYYLQNSFNTAKKGYCDIPHDSISSIIRKTSSRAWQQNQWYNNRAACESNGFVWYEVSLSDNVTGLASPICQRTQYARVNQLGNSWDPSVTFNVSRLEPQGLNANRFLWKVPTIPTAEAGAAYFTGANNQGMQDAYQSCVLRIRYNITTSDYPVWPPAAMESSHPWNGKMVDYRNNSKGAYDPSTPVTQDPFVYIGAGDSSTKGSQFVYVRANTNQYGRTFQDRSYKFAIRKRSTSPAAADNDKMTPAIPIISSTDTIVNVNVRGKRGNIVQTYPSVEYGFVPDQLALDQGNFIHFQFTGSDYNPRRGCNDANGGPPDPNDFISSANANQNSRADRSNVVFIDAMAAVTPTDMLGFKVAEFENLSYSQEYAKALNTTLGKVPCYGGSTTSASCYDTIISLAYLNQQSDNGGIQLRRGKKCLTRAEIDAITDPETARNHPLNCAVLNAAPYPYFDGGLMKVLRPGQYRFFSSRNNNFSNRDQKGVLCVRGTINGVTYTCDIDANTTNLHDVNPAMSTLSERAATSVCFDTASASTTANSDGATSCISLAGNDDILKGGTSYIFAQMNDAFGDGVKTGCVPLSLSGQLTGKQKTALLAGMLFLGGILLSFGAYYAYNRYRAKQGLINIDSPIFGGPSRHPVGFLGHSQGWRRQRADEHL